MSSTLKFLTSGATSSLRQKIKDNVGRYVSEESDPWHDYFDDEDIKTSLISVGEKLADEIHTPTSKNTYDEENSLHIYRTLILTPQQAADERIWAHLAHFDLRDYVIKRWPFPKTESQKENHIRDHYFVSGARGLISRNAISRLWWMGHVASRPGLSLAPERILEVLLHMSDVRANLLERHSLGMSTVVFNAVANALNDSYSDGTKKLFNRETFRDLMKFLNQTGGHRMLDALNNRQMQQLIKSAPEA